MDFDYYANLLDLRAQENERLLEDKFRLPFSAKSSNAKRKFLGSEPNIFPNIESGALTVFQKDASRIINSLGFKKLERKSQIFIAPHGDYFRTRNIHSLKVSSISSSIARQLRLSEDLSTAISLSHDIGHTPFGHNGEEKLNEIMGIFNCGFRHDIQGVRLVEKLNRENFSMKDNMLPTQFHGLNLTEEVIDGIRCHTKYYKDNRTMLNKTPFTLEGQIVRISDNIAYLVNDLNDATIANIISNKGLPPFITKLGGNTYERVTWMIRDCVKNSRKKIKELLNQCKKETHHLKNCFNCTIYKNFCMNEEPIINVSYSMQNRMEIIWRFIEDNIHKNKEIQRRNNEAKDIIEKLFLFYWENPKRLPEITKTKFKERHIPGWFLRNNNFQDLISFLVKITNKINYSSYKNIVNKKLAKEKKLILEIKKNGNKNLLDKMIRNIEFQTELSLPNRLFKLEFFFRYPNLIPTDILILHRNEFRKFACIKIKHERPLEIKWNSQYFSIKKYLKYKRLICDFIAGMTDRYALWAYKEFLSPEWNYWLTK